MPMFAPDNTIFKNELSLHEQFQPDTLQERDDELDEYRAALQAIIDGNPLQNVFLYGKTGVGLSLLPDHL